MYGGQRNFSKKLFPRWLKEELTAQSRVENPEITVVTKLKQASIKALISPTQHLVYTYCVHWQKVERNFFFQPHKLLTAYLQRFVYFM